MHESFQAARRRTLLGVAAAPLAGACRHLAYATEGSRTMDVAGFHARRRFADTASGRIAYVEQGLGPVALFIHGVPLNGFFWRHVMAQMQDTRRCIALDLMGLGYTQIDPRQDVSFTAQAQMVREFIDALGIDTVDLVTNDSGGGIGQIFAAHNAQRLRTLTLSNCDAHDNWPPAAFKPALELAREGTLIDRYAALIEDRPSRHARFTNAWSDPTVLTDEVYRTYIDPLRASAASRNNFHRYWLSFDNAQTVSIEPQLRRLKVRTLVVWALDDMYFDVRWAYWLKDTIPGVERVVEVPGAKLFFPEDRPDEFVKPLRTFLRI